MKKQLLLLNIVLFWCFGIKAQVLYTETFDSFTLGNLGTDPTGVTPGQGGWLTEGNNQYTQKNSLYTIANEPNKGKVLVTTINDFPYNTRSTVIKPNINTLIDQRTAGNNVIKFEIDYYTGQQHTYSGTNETANTISLNYITPAGLSLILFELVFRHKNGEFHTYSNIVVGSDGKSNYPQFPYNTWLKINVYLDYNNKKTYFEIPYFNKIEKADFLEYATSTNLMDDYKPSQIVFTQKTNYFITSTYPMVNKYNDIKITALNAVPAHVLDINEQLAQSFNLYPNPATTVVNITNNENLVIEKVVVYDVAGKQLNTQTFNSTEQTTQLNVENLTSGTYLLHLHTKDGVAVKKIIIK